MLQLLQQLLLFLALHSLLTAQAFEGVPCNATTIDCGQEFFKEVYHAFQTVEHEVIIMPFFIKPHLKIFSSVDGGLPDTTLEEVVARAVQRGVQVWILGWDTLGSEKFLPFHQDHWYQKMYQAAGSDHEHLHMMLDTSRSLLPSVYYLPHIKSYSFDRKVAYVGGIDFAENRLDTPQHVRPDPSLVQVPRDADHVTGNEKPWQDAMVKVYGKAAEHVAMILVERWRTYCESAGYSRSQATRPLDAVTNGLWGVSRAFRMSSWKDHQCKHLPRPGLLGSLSVQIIAGPTPHQQYTVEVTPPEVQSDKLTQPDAQTVMLRPSAAPQQIEVRGFRGLDRALPKMLPVVIAGQTFVAPSDVLLPVRLQDGATAIIRWLPDGIIPEQAGGQQCRVVLSGDHDWLGVQQPVKETYKEYLDILREARRFVFIENQYFSTDFQQPEGECAHGRDRSEAELYSGATNTLGEVLLDRLRQAGRHQENFTVSVIIPLATEPGSFYPNLRGTYCFEKAVEDMWKDEKLHGDWKDYFSFFFIANAVPVPTSMGGPGNAFYGIFTHTKAIVVDDMVAIIGSANINDRSFKGDRDAEVGVKVWGGPYPRELREKLLQGHIGNGSLCKPEELHSCLQSVAAANAGELYDKMGIKFPEGTAQSGAVELPFLGLKGVAGGVDTVPRSHTKKVVLKYPLSRRVAGGGGVDTFYWHVVGGERPPPKLQGLLFPWSRTIWGMPKMTQVTQQFSNEFNWRRLSEGGSEAADGPSNASALGNTFV